MTSSRLGGDRVTAVAVAKSNQLDMWLNLEAQKPIAFIQSATSNPRGYPSMNSDGTLL